MNRDLCQNLGDLFSTRDNKKKRYTLAFAIILSNEIALLKDGFGSCSPVFSIYLFFYLKALEVIPAELCKLLLFLLRGALHPCDAERLIGDDLVAFQTDRLLRLSILDAVTDDDHC